MFNNIIKLLDQIFAKEWVAAAIGGGGVLLCFAVCLILGLTTGDFVKNRRAALCIARGEIENGLKMLKGFAPFYDKSREISPPESAFVYDRLVGVPYSYSLIKKLPSVTLAGTAFFTAIAAAASVASLGGVTQYTVFMLTFVPLVGLILYITALIVAGLLFKSGGKRFYAMTGLIRDVNVRPSEAVTAESDFVPESVTEICTRTRNIALSGGADHRILSRLYDEIIGEREKYPDGEAGERLTAALDILNALIDSAL